MIAGLAPLAVTGATGFVGQAVLDEAERRKRPVRALARRPQAARAGVEWVLGDLADRAALARLMAGCAGVLHIAGVVKAPDRAGFRVGNVEGTEAVVAVARQQGCQRLVHVSSLAAREPGLSDYGWSKGQAEQATRQSGLCWTLVRPPAVYGPRDSEVLGLFRATALRLMPLPPPGRTSLIHVADLARLLLDLAQPAQDASYPLPGLLVEPDDGRPGGWRLDEFARAIGAAMGRKVWPIHLPPAVLMAAARLDRLVRQDKAQLTPDRARYMMHPDWVCDPALGVPPRIWAPAIESRAGLAQTADWYRRAGWL